MAITTEVYRSRVVEKLRRHLLRRGLPRLEMTTIVVATGLAGLAASALLLRLGMTPMAVRYPLAVLLAYASFLGMLRLWVSYHQRRLDRDFADLLPSLGSPQGSVQGGDEPVSSVRKRRSGPGLVDVVPDLPIGIPDSTGGCDVGAPSFGGGGGQFGGGGAGRSWSGSDVLSSGGGGGSSGSSSGSSGWSIDPDLDDAAVLLIPIALAVGAVSAAFYVLYVAPALMAEVVLDVIVVAGLYRRLRKLPPRSWLRTAVRRTWVLAFGLAAVFGVCGFLMQNIYADAVTVGQFLDRVRNEM